MLKTFLPGRIGFALPRGPAKIEGTGFASQKHDPGFGSRKQLM